ncbi:hypothetical protein D9M68_655380 [compost metagenome]
MRRDLRVDQQRYLRHAHAEQGRQHERRHAARSRVGPGRLQARPAQAHARQHAQLAQRRQLHTELQRASEQHAPRHGKDRLDALRGEPGRAPISGGDHRHVEQHRRGRRHSKALPGVQDAGRERHERHEGDVGKHPARHEDGGIEPFLAQTAGHGPHQHRRAQHTQHAGERERPGQHGGNLVDHQARGVVALLLTRTRQHRHECLAESTLGEEAAQQVGNAEGDVERVGQRTSAKGGRHEQFAHQSRDAGSEGEQGNERGGFEQGHGASVATRRRGTQFSLASILARAKIAGFAGIIPKH